MSALTLFGLIAVASMLLFYTLEHRDPLFILLFAGACLASSLYGFLQGAWPFGLVEAVWTVVALRRWRIAAVQRGSNAMTSDLPSNVPIACDMAAFTGDERVVYDALRARIAASVRDVRETGAGYRFLSTGVAADDIARWMALERRCCPFVSAALDLGSDGRTWIRIEAPPAARGFLAEEFGGFVTGAAGKPWKC